MVNVVWYNRVTQCDSRWGEHAISPNINLFFPRAPNVVGVPVLQRDSTRGRMPNIVNSEAQVVLAAKFVCEQMAQWLDERNVWT